jgi:hypothetical protein
MLRFPAWLLVLFVLPAPARPLTESLPAPVAHAHSFELLSNSRYSVHSGFTDTLPVQVLANVLWAMNRMPSMGDYREFYAATPDNVYRYDPSGSGLSVHRAGDHRYNSGSAFEVGVACERHEEAGMAIQAGLLAGTAFRDLAGGSVVSCPMKWASDYANSNWNPAHPIRMVDVFGRAQTPGLDTVCVAFSSDSSLPLPYVIGQDTFETVVAGLREDSVFSPVGLSLETISQLLWSAYGVTPHVTYNNRRGTTVPTAAADFNLTDRIYVVEDVGVERYHNRLPPVTDLASSDHRLERVTTGDLRPQLRAACKRIPGTAPVYFVICVSDTGSYQTMQEAGFAAFQLLAQARTLGLAGYLAVPLDRPERSEIMSALNLPSQHYPAVVFACGELSTGASENEDRPGLVRIVRANPAIRRGRMLLEYWLGQSGDVRVEVFDMLGRPARLLLEGRQSTGYHSVMWDGTGADGRRLKRGTYLVVVLSRGAVAKHKVTLG